MTDHKPGGQSLPSPPLLTTVGRHPFLVIILKVCVFSCTEKNEAENIEENEEPFIAPLGLNVPPDVELVRVPTSQDCHLSLLCTQGTVLIIAASWGDNAVE